MTDPVEQWLKDISADDLNAKLVLQTKFADLIVKERMTADSVIELFHAENKRLRAENERLREALHPFAAAAITYEPSGFMIEWDINPSDIAAARKALGETNG